MKKSIILLSMAAVLFNTSCNDFEQPKEGSQTATTESYTGKPITHKYDSIIDSIISQMTLEEKSGMLHGTSMFTTAGIERLGVPE